MDKNEIINSIIEVEGGFVDDERDSGGATCYGITEAVARRYGYTGAMRDLPRDTAFRIYEDQYWHGVQADALLAISTELAHEVVDCGINCGTSTAVQLLQTSLNALNLNATLYPDIAADGIAGPATLAALRGYAEHRDVAVLVKACNALQGAYYISVAKEAPKNERFVYGWLLNRV